MESTSPQTNTAQDEAHQIAARIEEIPSAEAAAILANLSHELAALVCEYLDPNTAGKILSQMDVQLAAAIISDMEPPEASVVLSAMNPDDRVDILGHVTSPLHDQLVSEMTAKDAADVLHLEQYPPDTAGGIMTTEVTALGENLTVEQAIAELRRLNEELEQMFYVYVVDVRRHLIGVLSMRDLIFARPDTVLSRIMRPNVFSVPATMDQEQVARVMRDTGYLAVPVVDDHHRLVGLITLDDAVEVIEEEATEDVQKMFGAGAEERLNSPWQYSFRKRVWWLEVNLATAFLAGSVVGYFQDTLSRLAILGVYMPIVAGMGGNASAQAMSVSIRGLAVGKVNRRMLWEVIYRELLVGLLTGIAIGLTTAIVAVLWQHSPMLGLVVGLALVINHILACTSGAAIPFIMKKLGYDPAQSATIFATTVTDVAGFFALFALASLFMRYLLN
ncbi:MAG: magnesium transporter [Phycisphaerales bacterium]|jgi:magnesium transporter|nr:magnesium transporter [Phycisphaerales bacterium]